MEDEDEVDEENVLRRSSAIDWMMDALLMKGDEGGALGCA